MTRIRSIASEAELAFFEERLGPDPDAAAWAAIDAMNRLLLRAAEAGMWDKAGIARRDRAIEGIEKAHAARWSKHGPAAYLAACTASDAEWRTAKSVWRSRTMRERRRIEKERKRAEEERIAEPFNHAFAESCGRWTPYVRELWLALPESIRGVDGQGISVALPKKLRRFAFSFR
jgi:hypothetical protein